jgi:hypothetical protein
LEGVKGPTEDPLPHVSEEAAQMDKILHGGCGKYGAAASPELEQGTPVAEVGLFLVIILFVAVLIFTVGVDPAAR